MFKTIISAGDLIRLRATQLEAQIKIFDCRHRLGQPGAGYALYRQGHIPGAIFVDLDTDLAAPVGMTPSGHSGRHPLPDPDTWMARLGAWGVEPSVQVFAYDDAGGAFAARLWWMVHVVGHDAGAVVNGGLQAWVAAGGALDTVDAIPKPAPSAYPGGFRLNWIATMEDVRAQVEGDLGKHAFLMVDARAPERFSGESEPLDPIAGHIPGARNMPYQQNLNPDGTFRSVLELRGRFEPLISQAQSREVVMYCGSGVSACHNLLAMEIAGLPAARLFPNSWSGWSNTPALPVARGKE